jgi:DNA repair exonuclease SbcCD ATPase subunit
VLTSLKKEVVALEKELVDAKASECSDSLIKLEEIDRELTKVEEQGHELLEQKKVLQTKISNLEILKTGFKEVKQFVFQTLLNELSVKATRLASELFEVPISIRFSNEDEDGGITKILTTVTLDGNERTLGLYSGGQYRRIELAVDLALASIVANRSQNPIKFRVLDEPFKDLSEPSMEKMVKLLEKLEGSTIIIEHNSITKSIIHNVFDIEYRNGVSHAV